MSSHSTYEEKELLRRVSSGDAAAFERLMNDFYLPCFQTALQVLRDRTQAKDIVQEAFLKVWLRRDRLPDIDNFGGWLRTITTHLIYDHISRSQRETGHLSRWAEALSLPAGKEAPGREEIAFEALIEEALAHLPPKQRETFILIKKEGRKREEAARIQGVSPETIKTNLERAMRSIRAYCLGKLDDRTFFVIFSVILKNYL